MQGPEMEIIGTDMPERDLDDEDEAYMDIRGGGAAAAAAAASGTAKEPEVDESVAPIEARVDPAEWQIELERVGPKLKITLAADTKVQYCVSSPESHVRRGTHPCPTSNA